MKTLQLFNPDSLEQSRKMSPEQVMEFLENFRLLAAAGIKSPTRLISLRVEEALLKVFKQKAKLEGTRYQTKIKELMRQYLQEKK